MVRVPVCKCCGFPIVKDEIGVVLTPLQRRIFNLVKRAGNVGISGRDMMDAIYINTPGGGPNSSQIIPVVKNQANKRLKQFNIQIATRRGPGALYRLERMSDARISKR